MKEQIEKYLNYIESHKEAVSKNNQKLRIYEGELLPLVKRVMKQTLSPHYFSQIEHRIIPINVLTRIVDKLAKVYTSPPTRTDENYQEFVDYMTDDLDIDLSMSQADEFSHLFKAYALEPYVDEGKAKMRVIPADRFLVMGEDKNNPLKVTTFIKFMGEVMGGDSLYYAYTKDNFIPFTSKGALYMPALEGNDGVNPYGFIPFVYGNRSRLSIIPMQDTDIIQLTLMIPVMLSDLAGAIMFSCFSIIYGIDLNAEKLEKSPNVFWNFKTDTKADNPKPEIGTIKSDVDIVQVMDFIKQTFAFWLETKGVRVGSLGSTDGAGASSGIAKIIDEMDIHEIMKQQINYFKKEEKELWQKLAAMNNHWLKSEEDYKGIIVGDDFNPTIVFNEPQPRITRKEEFESVDVEYRGGYMTALEAIVKLYPDLDEEQISERALKLDEVNKRDNPIGSENPELVIGSNSDTDSGRLD